MDPTVALLNSQTLEPLEWFQVSHETPVTTPAQPAQPPPSGPPVQIVDGPYRLPSGLPVAFGEHSVMRWANVDAVCGISIPPDNLQFRDQTDARALLTIDAESAAQYFLWRNRQWNATVVNRAQQSRLALWVNSDTAHRIDERREYHDFKVDVIVTGGVFVTAAQLEAYAAACQTTLLPGGVVVIRLHRRHWDQPEYGVILGHLAAQFNSVTVLEPVTRVEAYERYFVGREFRGPGDITAPPPDWSPYWQRVGTATSVLNPTGYKHIGQLYAWWLIPSDRRLNLPN